MTKDAYYFPHDSNAKDDPKCVLLIEQIGLEGYGIYWILVEILRDQPAYKYPFRLIPAIARKYNTTVEKVISVIKNYDLFSMDDDNFFFSLSLVRRMQNYDANKIKRTDKAKKAALKRWDAQAMLKQCSSNAQAMLSDAKRGEESIVDKSKVDETRKYNILSDIERRQIIGGWLEQFWTVYPKKIKKGLVEQIFFELFLNIQDLPQMQSLNQKIISAISKQKNHWKEHEFIPGPDKWLIDKRWEDECVKPETHEEMTNRMIRETKERLGIRDAD